VGLVNSVVMNEPTLVRYSESMVGRVCKLLIGQGVGREENLLLAGFVAGVP
jgi:hypothetical protein